MNPPERWVAVLGVAVLSVVAAAGFAIAIYAAWLFHDMPDAGDLVDYRPPTATRVYAADATLIGEFSTERRIFVPYDQMPTRLIHAFLSAEDRNFFHHSGVDFAGMARAQINNIGNLAHGRRLEGGSTITQQVAKNVLLDNEVTLGRKFKEAILASRLEQVLTKQQILELYLNEIWLGYRSYGVGAAAYNYFGKSISELTLAECAYLAALPKGPQNYHPIRNKAAAIARRNWILGQMVENGWVSREEAEAAMKQDLKVQPAPKRAQYQDADYFIEEVRRRSLATLGERLNEGGYYMRTTLDPRLQTAARLALMRGLEAYDRRHGWRGAWSKTKVEPGWQKVALKNPPPAERRGWRAAIVLSTDGGVSVEEAKSGDKGSLVSRDVSWARAGKGLKAGDLVFVEPTEDGHYRLRQTPKVNGALVVVEPYSGRVLAMVGGYSYSLSKFNRATQAERQPGSAFKPVVYATALENGYTPASTVMDSPITLKGANGEDWSPENYYHNYLGALTLRRGLELSRNTMTVRLAQGVGMRKISAMAIKLGVTDHMEPVLAMALGAGETSPLKLTAAYAAFVNGGHAIEPHLIELVENREGKTILRADKRSCPKCDAGFSGDESPRLPPFGKQVMDPITAYQISSMLEGVVQRGTGGAARVLNRPVGGKTGTTNEYRSAWFVGFTPQMVAGVFIGFDDNRSLGHGETGAVAALPVFIDFMQQATKPLPKTDIKAPFNAKFATINGIREAFRPGTEPQVRAPILPGLLPSGPQPYNKVWPGGRLSDAPNSSQAVRPRPPADDMSGLY